MVTGSHHLLKQARVARELVPGKASQPSIMFASKAGAYPSEARAYPQTLGFGGKVYQGQIIQLITNIHKFWT